MTVYKDHVRSVTDLNSDRVLFKVQGFSGTATAIFTTNIDWVFPEERWVSGGMLLVKGANWGDKVSLQIIDKDNVLGFGVNVVLDEYVTDFYVATDREFQTQMDCPYVALIPGGVYLRIKYTNTGLVNCSVALNLLSHIPKG